MATRPHHCHLHVTHSCTLRCLTEQMSTDIVSQIAAEAGKLRYNVAAARAPMKLLIMMYILCHGGCQTLHSQKEPGGTFGKEAYRSR